MRQKIREYRIRTIYYLRQGIGVLPRRIPSLLFLLSFVLFATILYPKMVHRLTATLASQPEKITLIGRVLLQSGLDPCQEPRIAEAAQVQIGGFATTTDGSGAYRLAFWTSTRDRIPVLIRYGGTTTLKDLDLPATVNKWTRNWTLQEE